jgi:hypothetical protein
MSDNEWIPFAAALAIMRNAFFAPRQRLIEALMLGEVRSRGKDTNQLGQPRKPIPKRYWAEWKFIEDKGWLQPKTRRRVFIGYINVTISSGDVEKLAARPKTERGTNQPPTAESSSPRALPESDPPQEQERPFAQEASEPRTLASVSAGAIIPH